jgi:hypothetical protein
MQGTPASQRRAPFSKPPLQKSAHAGLLIEPQIMSLPRFISCKLVREMSKDLWKKLVDLAQRYLNFEKWLAGKGATEPHAYVFANASPITGTEVEHILVHRSGVALEPTCRSEVVGIGTEDRLCHNAQQQHSFQCSTQAV